jgi:signal transduction histidine kinase
MPGRGLKFDLTVTMAFLLTTGMLLTDFVIMGLWQHHANQACREKLTHSLALTVASLQDVPASLTPGDHIRAELERQGLCLHIVSAVKGANLPVYSCVQDRNVATLVEAVLRDGQTVVRPVDRQGQSEWFGRKWLVIAQPLYQGKDLIGAVGLAGPMTTLFDLALTSQQQILVYILINALILTVIGFFRISRMVIRPLERLINLTDNYQAQEVVLFASQGQSNEIRQLSASLNSVVQRIEHDKGVLKQTVEELARKNRRLQENQQEMVRAEKLASVGRLAAGLAHEIGNPLGVAQGYLQLLSMDDSGKDERSEYVARALKELDRVDGLIRQLLDYARTAKGEPQRFDVQELLAELGETLRVQPFLEGIRLDLVLQAQKAIVFADREQLRQVILNCLINAADAIKACRVKGEGAIFMATSLAAHFVQDNDPLLLQIAIQDNGEGMSPELLETAFDPFFTTKEPGSGTGLGLSVSLALIESMGGSIRLQSAAGEGTTVLLLLPLVAETAVGAGASVKEDAGGYVDAPEGNQC